MPLTCSTRRKDGVRKGRPYNIETIILRFTCPINMEKYSFDVFKELFKSTVHYENYFPLLRGDAYRFSTVPFGFTELTARFLVMVLEIEKKILYELLTTNVLMKTECLPRSQGDKITMNDDEIISKLHEYWRDKCILKAACDPMISNYWEQIQQTDEIEKTTDFLEEGIKCNTPHFFDDCSRVINKDGEKDLVYKLSSRRQVTTKHCIDCNETIPQRCLMCSLTKNSQEPNHEGINPVDNFSIHRYTLNNSLFIDYYLFSINLVNKGTQLNRVKGELRGTVLNSNGIVDDSNQHTLFRQLYMENGYLLLDAELNNEQHGIYKKNWNEEALERHKKTATISNSINERKRKNTCPTTMINNEKK